MDRNQFDDKIEYNMEMRDKLFRYVERHDPRFDSNQIPDPHQRRIVFEHVMGDPHQRKIAVNTYLGANPDVLLSNAQRTANQQAQNRSNQNLVQKILSTNYSKATKVLGIATIASTAAHVAGNLIETSYKRGFGEFTNGLKPFLENYGAYGMLIFGTCALIAAAMNYNNQN